MRDLSSQISQHPRLTDVQGYIKGIREYLQTNEPERVPSFEKGASAFAKLVSTNFKDYEFVGTFISELLQVIKYLIVHRKIYGP